MQTKLSRYCEGLLEAIWLAAVIIVPLFFNTYSSRIFEPDKVAILRSLALLAAGIWCVKLLDAGIIPRFFKLKKPSMFQSFVSFPMAIPVFGLVFGYLISTIFSIIPGVSLLGSYQRLQGTYTTISYIIIFVVIVANMRRMEQVERLLTSIIIASLPVTIYGLLQRFSLDPIPWAGNTVTRIAANMGNSIFVAAYLIMVVPLTAGRLLLLFRKIVTEDKQRVMHIAVASIYTFILGLQLIAIYLSQSRGPVLGLLVGGFLMAIMLSAKSKGRWISFSVIGVGIVVGALLIGFNLENGPFRSLQEIPGVGRYAKLLDPESSTAQTRKYIWQGATDLVGMHPPVKFPDGETDRYNSLRPLIGYGPETMYVAFNQFYPPELGHFEKRNASPDRSHNETWDAIVFTGLSGLIAYLMVFGGIFYYGLRWMGFIGGKIDIALLAFLGTAGGIGGAVGFSLWRGIEYLGIGLPFGLVAGLLLCIIIIGVLRRNNFRQSEIRSPDGWVITMLFSALVAHFIEINFGIAIVSTRMLFWIYAGLMVVIGAIITDQPCNEVRQSSLGGISGMAEEKLDKRLDTGKHTNNRDVKVSSPDQNKSLKKQMFLIGFILSLIMVTLSFDYIVNSQGNATIGSILINSYTSLGRWDSAFSAGILVLCIATLIMGVILFASEGEINQNKRPQWVTIGVAAGIATVIWVIYSMIHAGKLAAMAQVKPQNQYDVFGQVADFGRLLTFYYVVIGLLVFGIAFFLIREKNLPFVARHSPGIISAPVILVVVLVLIKVTNLQVINADIAFKMAEPFVNTNQWKMATYLLQRAIELAPMEDHYYLFLGRSYLEQGRTAQSITELDEYVKQAEINLKIAQSISPLNTDHTANLARLFYWWASRAPDSAIALERGRISNEYFQTAVMLSPNNMTLWGEWAILNIQILKRTQEAFDLLSRAIEIDPKYCFTQGLMGDFYSTIAVTTDDPAEKVVALEQAAQYYSEAALVHTDRDTTLKSSYLIFLGNTYIETAGQVNQESSIAYSRLAIEAFEGALQADLPVGDRWRLQEILAQLYASLGDYHSALVFAQSALVSAPENAKERLIILIEEISQLP